MGTLTQEHKRFSTASPTTKILKAFRSFLFLRVTKRTREFPLPNRKIRMRIIAVGMSYFNTNLPVVVLCINSNIVVTFCLIGEFSNSSELFFPKTILSQYSGKKKDKFLCRRGEIIFFSFFFFQSCFWLDYSKEYIAHN